MNPMMLGTACINLDHLLHLRYRAMDDGKHRMVATFVAGIDLWWTYDTKDEALDAIKSTYERIRTYTITELP